MPSDDQDLRQLLRHLEQPTSRRRAVHALAKLEETAVAPLGRVVRAGDPDTRLAAAQALVLIGEPAFETLSVLLGDTDRQVAQCATRALVRIGAPVVAPLCRRLADPNPRVGHRAANVLARVRKPALDSLCRFLAHPEPDVRARAVRSLAKAGSKAIPTLVGAFRDPGTYAPSASRTVDPEQRESVEAVRRGAASALLQIEGCALDVLRGGLVSRDPNQRRVAVWALEQGGDPAVDALIRTLEEEGALRERLTETREPAPVLAARSLGKIGSLRALAPLARALDHRDVRVRRAAAEGLRALAAETGAPELRACLPHLLHQLRKTRRLEEREPIEKAIRTIETATGAIADVPLPAAPLSRPEHSLPRPAEPSLSDTASLPIAGAGEPDAAPIQRGWWFRVTRYLRSPH